MQTLVKHTMTKSNTRMKISAHLYKNQTKSPNLKREKLIKRKTSVRKRESAHPQAV